MDARGLHRFDLGVEMPRAEPAEAVVLEDGPRAHRDEHDHPDHDHPDQRRHRAERSLGAVVRPGASQSGDHP
jgi:hypothetical protein